MQSPAKFCRGLFLSGSLSSNNDIIVIVIMVTAIIPVPVVEPVPTPVFTFIASFFKLIPVRPVAVILALALVIPIAVVVISSAQPDCTRRKNPGPQG
jgi:hypothetical protein